MTTLGIEVEPVWIKIHGQTVKVKIWDTAGQERLAKLTNSFLRNLDGVMLVFDLTDRQSFDNTLTWYKQICENSDIPIVFIGNKSDLRDQRVVQEGAMERVARDFKFTPFETSAVNGSNVETAFGCLFYKILEPCLDKYAKIQKLFGQEDN